MTTGLAPLLRAVPLLSSASVIADLHYGAGIAAEDVDHLDAGFVDTFARIAIKEGIACGLEAAVLASAVILPLVLEGLALLPVEVHRPEVDEVEAVLCRPILESSQLLAGDLRQGGNELLFFFPETFLITGSASSTATSKKGGGAVRFFSMISLGMVISLIRTSSEASISWQTILRSISNSQARQWTSLPPASRAARATALTSSLVRRESMLST